MSALVAKLQEQYEDQYQRSITPVELRQLNSVESTFTLNKPSYAVLRHRKQQSNTSTWC
jgi:hypothetical protein